MTSKQESAKSIPQSPKANSIVKRESFRGSEISDPILVCTTNRNSLVLADGKVDIIGPEAKTVSRSPPTDRPGAVTVKRSQSERPVSRQDPLRPACVPPPPANSTLRKTESARSPTRAQASAAPVTAAASGAKPNSSGFRSRPVPPVPTYEEDDTQPIYTNETSDMNDLLSAIQGALKDSCNLYNNLSPSDVHGPIQETAPPAPPRPALLNKKTNSTTHSSAADKTNDRTNGELFRNTSVQRPFEPALVSKKTVSNPKSSTKVGVGASGDKQNTISKTDQPNITNTSTISSTVSKPVGTSAKSNLTSESSLNLKGAVSDELKKKILSRSDSSAKAQTNSSLSQKPKTPSVSLSSTTPSQKTNSGLTAPAVTDKPLTTKLPSTDSQKPVTRTGSQAGSKQVTTRVTSPNSDTAQASSANRPVQPKAKSVVGNTAVGNAVLSDAKKSSGSTSDAAGSTNFAKSNSGSSSRDRTSEAKSAGGLSSNVSNLAAKFIQASDGAAGKATAKAGLPSEDPGRKPIIKKTSQTEKPTLPSRPKVTSSKPETSEMPASGTPRSLTNSSRPNLPPKPGEQGSAAPASSNTQLKRVQSYRI